MFENPNSYIASDKALFFFFISSEMLRYFFLFLHETYHIQPNYRPVHLGFQNYWENLW